MFCSKSKNLLGHFLFILCTLYYQPPCQEVAQFGIWDFRSKTGGGVYLAGGGLGAAEEKWNASEVWNRNLFSRPHYPILLYWMTFICCNNALQVSMILQSYDQFLLDALMFLNHKSFYFHFKQHWYVSVENELEQKGNKTERKKDEKMMNMIQKTSRQITMNYDEFLISN